MISPDLLTPEEVADQLQIGRTTVYKLIKTGELRSVALGTQRRVRPERYLDGLAS